MEVIVEKLMVIVRCMTFTPRS